MIDDDEESSLTDEDEAFLEQWLKLWYRAAQILFAAGWRPEAGFHTDFWRSPPDVRRTVWAAHCVQHDAFDARTIKAKTEDPFVHDAADTMVALSFVVEAIARPGVDRAAVRSGALWGINGATFLLRRHAQITPLTALTSVQAEQVFVSGELARVRAILEPRLPGIAAKSENAYSTAEKRRRWWPRAQEIARTLLEDDPRTTNDAIATEIVEAGRRAGPDFEPPGHRTVSETVGKWRGIVDGIAYPS